jgi:hypothetical protein
MKLPVSIIDKSACALPSTSASVQQPHEPVRLFVKLNRMAHEQF